MPVLNRYADAGAAAVLVGAVVVYALQSADFTPVPAEDAAMLMRYADHLAHGHGIVWNIGQPPVDGATDFLFMIVAAAVVKLGASIGDAVRSIGLLSHVLTVLIVYWTNRTLWKAGVVVSLFSSLYLVFGTGLSYVAAFFGTPFFALFAAMTWFLALRVMDASRPGWMLTAGFALSGLATGLIRPEGVILASLMLAAIVVARGLWASVKPVVVFGLAFLIFGGAYFLWRWHYFGHPFPNPYYKKGAGTLHWSSLLQSLINVSRLVRPFILAFILGLRSTRTARRTLAFSIPLAGFAGAFILISDEMNFGGRFQYVLLPLVLMSWFPLVNGIGREVQFAWPNRRPWSAWLAWTAIVVAITFSTLRYSAAQNCVFPASPASCTNVGSEVNGLYTAGRALAAYQGKGYTVATTEAGLIPLYSGWNAIDTWGLNDEWIAHHGEVTEDYLDRFKPEVIMVHAYFSPLVPPVLYARGVSQSWLRMTITLKRYAETNGYILAAAFGDSPYQAHYYYVRPGGSDSANLVADIAALRYGMSGRTAMNYAAFRPALPDAAASVVK